MAYAGKSKALLAKVITIVSGLSGMGTVSKGVPESLDTRAAAYCCLGTTSPTNWALASKGRTVDILIVFYYRVAGAEATAEDAICDFVDLLIDALEADETLGGLCYEATLDFSLASSPEYQAFAGEEDRRYPVVVHCEQEK